MTLKEALSSYGIDTMKQTGRQQVTPEMQKSREIEYRERARKLEKAKMDRFYNEAFDEYMRGI